MSGYICLFAALVSGVSRAAARGGSTSAPSVIVCSYRLSLPKGKTGRGKDRTAKKKQNCTKNYSTKSFIDLCLK